MPCSNQFPRPVDHSSQTNLPLEGVGLDEESPLLKAGEEADPDKRLGTSSGSTVPGRGSIPTPKCGITSVRSSSGPLPRVGLLIAACNDNSMGHSVDII